MSSLIEKAVQRLDLLKKASSEPAARTEPELKPTEQERPAAAPKERPAAKTVAPEQARAPASQERPPATAPRERRETPVAAEQSRGPSVSRSVRIDLARLAQMGMVTPDLPRSLIAEEYRVIKRPLLRNAHGQGAAAIESGNLIMVTSSMPGEGKSFSAINLAISLAMELDHTVLLVDADVSRPSVLNRLGLMPERGLMDVLSGGVSDVGDVMLKTNIEKLTLLPAGMPHQRATELLASDAMNRLLEQMATRYADRIIVFDSPPLLMTTEARVLATHMGQIVIVVEAAKTSHSTLKQALVTIENCPVKLMLLNKTRERGAGNYYGYGYGYGYGADAKSETA